MPTAADYAATASSVYDPQATAETTAAGQGLASANAAADSATRNDKAAFATSQDTLKTAHESNNANNDFHYTEALGGNSSGLQANTNNIEGNNYLKSLTTLGTDEANKLADVASSRTLAAQNYSSTLASITAKYAGLKSGYVADQLSHQADQQFQQRMAQESEANATKNAQITAASYNQPAAADPKVSLNSDIHNSLTGFLTRPNGYSESTILPALYKQYGGQIPMADIKAQFYDTRKALGYG